MTSDRCAKINTSDHKTLRERYDVSTSMEFSPLPFKIAFYRDGVILGSLTETDDNKLAFVGNADESAKVFWECISNQWPLSQRLEALQAQQEPVTTSDDRLMSMPAEQHPGEPAAWRYRHSKPGMSWFFTEKTGADGCLIDGFDYEVQPLYTHADPGEVEQFPHGSPANKAVFMALESYTGATTFEQACIQLAEESRALRAQLAEANRLLTKIRDTEIHEGRLLWDSINNHLSASAEPSTPVEIDEPTDLATWKRRAIEAESKLRSYAPQVVELGEQAMQALLAEPKPSELVLTKCKLCDQLQADLTERDERIDQLRSGYVFETGPYQVELSEDQWNAALGVFENYNMGDDKHFVFLEEQGRGVISEILIEIGVARAPDADEVVE